MPKASIIKRSPNMNTALRYILVDDDSFCNRISTMIITDALGDSDIEVFTEPEKALDFIKNQVIDKSVRSVVFLDLNMPMFSGWDFLDTYKEFSSAIKGRTDIYILSSSIDERDKDRAAANENVKGFISKPLDDETLTAVAANKF